MNCIKSLLVFATFAQLSAAQAAVPGVTDKEVTLGNHSIQSGAFSIYGALQRTERAYYESINEKGGVEGRKINFVIEDSAGNIQQALQVTKKLVQKDNVLAMVGSHGFMHTGVYKFLRESNVPDLWINDPTAIYSDPAHPTTIAWYPTYAHEAKIMGEYMAKHMQGKKLGILKLDYQAGKESADAITKAVGDKLPIVAVEEFNSREPNVNSQILKLKQAGVEVIYTSMFSPLTASAIKFAHEQGFKPIWFVSFSNANKPTLDVIGKELMEGVISWSPVYTEEDTHIPGIKAHLEFMKAKLPNEKPSALTIMGQAQGELMVETLKRAGKNLTRESLVKAAESFKDWQCSVCRSPNSTGPNKHLFNTTVKLLVARNGKWVELEEGRGLSSK